MSNTKTKTDILDATGYRPGDIKEINGQFRQVVIMPIRVGTDEYETRLRWHLVPAKLARKLRQRLKEPTK